MQLIWNIYCILKKCVLFSTSKLWDYCNVKCELGLLLITQYCVVLLVLLVLEHSNCVVLMFTKYFCYTFVVGSFTYVKYIETIFSIGIVQRGSIIQKESKRIWLRHIFKDKSVCQKKGIHVLVFQPLLTTRNSLRSSVMLIYLLWLNF